MIARSVFSNWIALLLTGAVSFAMAPLLIHRMGPLYFGMWSAVGSFSGYYGLLDVGMTATLQRYVARYVGSGQRQELNETYISALTLSSTIGALVCVLAGGSTLVLPRFFHVSAADAVTFRRVLLLSGMAIGVGFPAGTTAAYLRGLQRYDIANAIAILTTLLRSAAVAAALLSGHGVTAVAGITFAASVLSLAIQFVAVRRVDRDLKLHIRDARWYRLRELFNFSIFVGILTIGDYLRFNLDSTVIGRCLTLAMVTPFAVAATVMTYFVSVIGGLTGPFLSEMSRLQGNGDDQAVRGLFLRLTRVTCITAGIGASVLILNGRMLLHLWLGEGFETSYYVLVTLAVGYAIALSQSPAIPFLYAHGRHRPMAYWTVLEGIANVMLSIWLAYRIGLIGVALGTAIPMSVIKLTVQPWYALRVSKVGLMRYLREALGPGLMVCMVVVSITCLCGLNHAENIPAFLEGLAFQACLFFLATWGLALDSVERTTIRARLRRLVIC